MEAFPLNNTICAIATPAGGAIGVIRVSGENAVRCMDGIFSKSLADAKGFTLHYGEIKDGDDVIDDVMVSLFRAPRSYTGEDAVEISCHGSAYIMRRILQLLIRNGCRQAGPGEYTKRAFLHGKMDLSQAEAVADLISASNQASHRLAVSQLRGHFSDTLSLLRDELLHLTTLLELELDFSDHEDLEFADRKEILSLAGQIDRRITTLSDSFQTGNALKEGIPVAIVGKTNVGKSTLLNQLLHEERAIVSDIHGTTRDVIEDTVQLHGVTYRFIDTAGIRQTRDTIEQLGIDRTWQMIHKALIVVWLTDEEPSSEETEEMLRQTEGKHLIQVRNKSDLNPSAPTDTGILNISAKYGSGISELEEAIYQAADIPEINESDVIVTNARHYEALLHAHESLTEVIHGLEMNLSADLLSESLRSCLHHLADITGGAITPDETLQNVFKNFCVGK